MSLADIQWKCECGGVGYVWDEEKKEDRRCYCFYKDRAQNLEMHLRIPAAFRLLNGQYVLDKGYGFSDDTDRRWWDAITKDPEAFVYGNGIQLVCEDQRIRMAFAMHTSRYIMLAGLSFTYFDWGEYVPSFWQHWREDVSEMYREMREARGLILDNFTGVNNSENHTQMSTIAVRRFCCNSKFTILASSKPIQERFVGHDFYNYMTDRCGRIRLVKKQEGEQTEEES